VERKTLTQLITPLVWQQEMHPVFKSNLLRLSEKVHFWNEWKKYQGWPGKYR